MLCNCLVSDQHLQKVQNIKKSFSRFYSICKELLKKYSLHKSVNLKNGELAQALLPIFLSKAAFDVKQVIRLELTKMNDTTRKSDKARQFWFVFYDACACLVL